MKRIKMNTNDSSVYDHIATITRIIDLEERNKKLLTDIKSKLNAAIEDLRILGPRLRVSTNVLNTSIDFNASNKIGGGLNTNVSTITVAFQYCVY